MRCAVLGHPVAHSLSPAMHRAAYEQLGLDWTYEAVDVEVDALEPFLNAVGDDVVGFSVTAPLKRRLVELADVVSGDAELLGVGNTVLFGEGRREVHNTDVGGGVAALTEAGITAPRTVRIIGGGATAASMLLSVARLGAEAVELDVRSPDRAEQVIALATRLGVALAVRAPSDPLVSMVDLVVSTVPTGAVADRAREHVAAAHAVFDVVYDPWPTALGSAAASAGVPLVNGLDLLAHQAALQVELMTGGTVHPQVLRTAALTELASR